MNVKNLLKLHLGIFNTILDQLELESDNHIPLDHNHLTYFLKGINFLGHQRSQQLPQITKLIQHLNFITGNKLIQPIHNRLN